MTKDAAKQIIFDNFELDDHLAVVRIDRQSGVVMQRIASAGQIASPELQVWLKSENRSGRDVFVSMNALAEEARGRTRRDVAVVRHLYLDFDENGTRAVQDLRNREKMPQPSYVVNTSPDHWQVSWSVQGFVKEQAESTMRELVREFGADPAATDCARVMRIPGFVNHKRHPTHLVCAERLSTALYTPDQFPRPEQEDRVHQHRTENSDHLIRGNRTGAHLPIGVRLGLRETRLLPRRAPRIRYRRHRQLPERREIRSAVLRRTYSSESSGGHGISRDFQP